MSDHQHDRCHDFLSTLSDYIDGDLSAELCADLERHLCECDRCRVVVDTLKKTIELYQDLPDEDGLPEDVRARLYARLDLDDYQKESQPSRSTK